MQVTPEYVLSLKGPTKGFLCPLSANVYNLDFIDFQIKDLDSNEKVFQVSKKPGKIELPPNVDPDRLRTIAYTFPVKFIDYQNVGTKLTFAVGDKPVKNFRMIERHYCGDQLIKSYDFVFPFCIPGSTNTWDTEYEMPVLSPAMREKVIRGGFQDNQSDSFYFVDNQLVMHNKAVYRYVPNDQVKLPIVIQ